MHSFIIDYTFTVNILQLLIDLNFIHIFHDTVFIQILCPASVCLLISKLVTKLLHSNEIFLSFPPTIQSLTGFERNVSSKGTQRHSSIRYITQRADEKKKTR